MNRDITPGCRRGNHQGARFNLIRNHCIGRAVKMLLSSDSNDICAGTFDSCAHTVEEVRKINDMRLFCGIINNRGSVCLGSSQHDIDRSADCHHIKKDIISGELFCIGRNQSAAFFSFCTKGCKPFQVLIDRSGTDFTTARISDFRFSTAAQQGAEEIIACTQLSGPAIVHLITIRFSRINHHMDARHIIHFRTERAQNVRKHMDIFNIRNVLNRTYFVRKKDSGNHSH